MALTCKTDLDSLVVGDYVWCKYAVGQSGGMGVFSDLATKTDAQVASNLISTTAPGATPSGYFKLICVGIDALGRKKLIADRNIQSTVSFDTINTGGYGSGSGTVMDNTAYGSLTKLANPASLPTGGANGTAFSHDGNYMAIAHGNTPFITIYKRSGDTFTKLTSSALPTGVATGVAFSFDGTYMAVAHDASPYVTIYKRSGDTFTKLSNPSIQPNNTANGVAFSPDGTYMSVVHDGTPYVTIYKRSGDTFAKLNNPATLPAGASKGVAFSPDNTYMTVAHYGTPFITIYKRSGDTFTKLTNPTTLPTGSTAYTVSFSPDSIYMSVGEANSPYLHIYKRSAGDTFTRLTNPTILPSNAVFGVAFSTDGTYMAVLDGSLIIYKRSGDTFTKLANHSFTAATMGVSFSTDGTYLSVAHYGSPYVSIFKSDTFNSNSRVSISARLVSGGSGDSEWSKIVSEYNLGGLITAGDNGVWNWNGIRSWTLSSGSTATSKVARGSGTVTATAEVATSSATTSDGFRPMFLLTTNSVSKFLLQDGTTIYTVNGGVRSIVGTSPVTESLFVASGMDDLSGINNTHLSDLSAPKVLNYKT